MTPHEKLAQILATDTIDEATCEDLILSFFVLDPISYARKLQALRLPLPIHSALLVLKVDTPMRSLDATPILEATMTRWLERITEKASVAV